MGEGSKGGELRTRRPGRLQSSGQVFSTLPLSRTLNSVLYQDTETPRGPSLPHLDTPSHTSVTFDHRDPVPRLDRQRKDVLESTLVSSSLFRRTPDLF